MEQKVKLYGVPKCPQSMMAKEFMAQQGVDFEEYDVSLDALALQEMKKISGGNERDPVFVVGHEVLVGYDWSQLDKAIKRL